MTSFATDVLILTPRGGPHNHRYVLAEGSRLDAAECGQVYRAAKAALPDVGSVVSSLGDGRWFVAASHEVEQEESSGRRGIEWLIFIDERIGRLGATERDRLRASLLERLSCIKDDVLARVAWGDLRGTDIVRHRTLDEWGREFAAHAGSVPHSPRSASGSPHEGSRGDERGRVQVTRRLVIVGGIIVAFLGLVTWINPFPAWLDAGRTVQPEESRIVAFAAEKLGVAPDGPRIAEGLSQLFLDPESRRGKTVKESLDDVRIAAFGAASVTQPLTKDDRLWSALSRWRPPPGRQSDALAFVDPDQQTVLQGCVDPIAVRELAEIASQIHRFGKDAARPTDASLTPLFNAVYKHAADIDRLHAEPALRVFTNNDAEVSQVLVRIFQTAGESIEREVGSVTGKDSLAAWTKAIASAPGLYSRAYFDSQQTVVERHGSQQQRDCLSLLRKFCELAARVASPAPSR